MSLTLCLIHPGYRTILLAHDLKNAMPKYYALIALEEAVPLNDGVKNSH